MGKAGSVKIFLVLAGLSLSAGVSSHPYDSPLTFIEHENENGGKVYTNIPRKCFANGVLICANLHPAVAGNPPSGS